VDKDGVAIDGKWGYCTDACITEGHEYEYFAECWEHNGICIDATHAAKFAADTLAIVDTGANTTQPAPACGSVGNKQHFLNQALTLNLFP
jgi:hypothetical protein